METVKVIFMLLIGMAFWSAHEAMDSEAFKPDTKFKPLMTIAVILFVLALIVGGYGLIFL